MTEKTILALSPQAISLAVNLKEIDMVDFRKWWEHLSEVTQVGTAYLFQYLDMKQRGEWKDGEFNIQKI